MMGEEVPDENEEVPAVETAGEADMEEEELKSSSGQRISAALFEEMRTHYELGTKNATDLSREYGVNGAALKKRFYRAGVKYASRAKEIGKVAETAAKRSVANSAETFMADRKAKIEETKTQHYNWGEVLAKLTFGCIVEAKKAGRPVATEMGNIKALRIAANTLDTILKQRWTILNVDAEVDETQLPELIIRDFTEADLKAIRKKQEDDEDEDEFEVDEPDISDLVQEDDDGPGS